VGQRFGFPGEGAKLVHVGSELGPESFTIPRWCEPDAEHVVNEAAVEEHRGLAMLYEEASFSVARMSDGRADTCCGSSH
jgi:hypothetical protein